MTIDAHCVDDDVHQKCNDDEMMGTILPTGQIRHCRCHVSCLGGALGGSVGGLFGTLLMLVELGSPFFFFDDAMCVLACIIIPPKSMVNPPCKYLCRLIRGRGTR
jgi:hypothetical protein